MVIWYNMVFCLRAKGYLYHMVQWISIPACTHQIFCQASALKALGGNGGNGRDGSSLFSPYFNAFYFGYRPVLKSRSRATQRDSFHKKFKIHEKLYVCENPCVEVLSRIKSKSTKLAKKGKFQYAGQNPMSIDFRRDT